MPFDTWEALRSEDITTLDRLQAMADQIHTLPGIGPKTAQLIRQELARVTASKKIPDQARALIIDPAWVILKSAAGRSSLAG
ncbi:helix-hairpin-helix domain-containing protein [Microvirga sp. Mcv34]|uniref:helix-hairpin-helix domain-containing protein n=1 Tax=Microvirga sp. Mcv34 TaxID=2926016 RepID=UPI0021C5DBE7|nr:helix-hairpin-helix domain-containing protein [Microvirga sp. Mcv34]